MERRSFLKAAGALALTSGAGFVSAAGSGLIEGAPGFYRGSEALGVVESTQPPQDVNADWRSVLLSGTRDLWLKRREAGIDARLQYVNGQGGLDIDGYTNVCKALRDVHAGVAVYMSVDLLDILCGIQRWLIHYGYTAPIIITSGYRTPERNRSIEGAARNSLHTKGMAVDIRIPGVSTQILGRMAQMFQRGGVGFYMNKDFVHIDVGRVRYWKG